MASSFLKRRYVKPALIILIAGIPLWMWLAWLLTPKRKLVVAIIDKTVLTKSGQEHISLNWVLNQEKFSKNNSELYQRDKDYYGFFPLENKQYRLKGLERFAETQLQKLSVDADVAYLTDAYGIYLNEWYQVNDDKERSGLLYGGMSAQDLFFLKQMKEKHKLIITEFNCIGSPTAGITRNDFENSFGIRWTGWIGRYFESFDTTINTELPKWLIRNYKAQHNNKWPFTKSGIAYVHSDDRIVILENETDLTNELPSIVSGEEGQNYYGMPAKLKYSFWFDIVNVDSSFNHVVSNFVVEVNAKGKQELQKNGIPVSFPAITAHINKDYRFFYFAADFCDNPISIAGSYFKGIEYFKWMMYNTRDPQERASFFWTIYRPLMTRILEDYYRIKK